jgi:hypothetical protein
MLARLRDEGVDVRLGVELLRASKDGDRKLLEGRVAGEDFTWRGQEILVA